MLEMQLPHKKSVSEADEMFWYGYLQKHEIGPVNSLSEIRQHNRWTKLFIAACGRTSPLTPAVVLAVEFRDVMPPHSEPPPRRAGIAAAQKNSPMRHCPPQLSNACSFIT